jgi:hypothetical protein
VTVQAVQKPRGTGVRKNCHISGRVLFTKWMVSEPMPPPELAGWCGDRPLISAWACQTCTVLAGEPQAYLGRNRRWTLAGDEMLATISSSQAATHSSCEPGFLLPNRPAMLTMMKVVPADPAVRRGTRLVDDGDARAIRVLSFEA